MPEYSITTPEPSRLCTPTPSQVSNDEIEAAEGLLDLYDTSRGRPARSRSRSRSLPAVTFSRSVTVQEFDQTM